MIRAAALGVVVLLDVFPRCGGQRGPPLPVMGRGCSSQLSCGEQLKCYAFDPPRPAPHEGSVCSAPCTGNDDCARWGAGLVCTGFAREEGTTGAPLKVCALR